MKGHSERVPNKNLKNFAGKPLYHAIVSEFSKSKWMNNIIINTDSQLIQNDILLNFPSVTVIDRPAKLIGDFVSMNDIIAYDLSKTDSDIFVQTHSTNPLLLSTTLDRAIEFFSEHSSRYDSVFSVTRIQSRLYWEDGNAINHNPVELLRTQDLPAVYEENSSFYIFTKESFSSSGNKRIGNNPYMFEIDRIEAIDIDEQDDFLIAEVLYKSLRKKYDL